MPEFERPFAVMAGADAAFELLSDPVRLPEYVPTLRLTDSTAVEGELDVDADLAERDGAPDAGFAADRKMRHMAWGHSGDAYGGSIDVSAGTTSTASVTIRLRTRDDAGAAEVVQVMDQAATSIRRMFIGRR